MKCLICNSGKFKSIYKSKNSLLSNLQYCKGIKTHKLICEKCGFVRNQNLGIDHNFYENEYKIYDDDFDPILFYQGEEKKRSEFIFEWISSFVDSSVDKILEIGCGNGNLLANFNTKDKIGLEPNKNAFNIALKKCTAINTSFENFKSEAKYNLILSVCVLEHTKSPDIFLKKCKKLLSSSGKIIIIIPIQNVKSYDVLFNDHLFHFSKSQFERLCHDQGLKIENFQIGYKSIYDQACFVLKNEKNTKEPLEFFDNKNFNFCKNLKLQTERILISEKYSQLFLFGNGERSKVLRYLVNFESIKYIIDDHNYDNKAIFNSDFFISNESKNHDSKLLLLSVNPSLNELLIKKFQKIPNLTIVNPFDLIFI